MQKIHPFERELLSALSDEQIRIWRNAGLSVAEAIQAIRPYRYGREGWKDAHSLIMAEMRRMAKSKSTVMQ